MRAPGRPVKLTCDAPFHAYSNPIYFNVSIQGGSEIVIPILIGGGAGYNPRVHEGCETKVHDDKNRQNALV